MQRRSSQKRQASSTQGRGIKRQDEQQAVPLSVAGGLDATEILGLMAKVKHPLRIDDLMRFLDLSRRDKKALEALLETLQEQGRLLRLQGGKWVEASQSSVITGVLSIQRSGAGFVTPDTLAVVEKNLDAEDAEPAEETDAPDTEDATVAIVDAPSTERFRTGRGFDRSRRGENVPGMQQDIFIRSEFLGDAWHGDRVEVVTSPAPVAPRTGRSERLPRNPEGRIVRVIERRQKELAAHVTRRTTARGVLCRPADPRLNFLLDVAIDALSVRPRTGELLLVTPGEKIDDGLWIGVAQVSLGLESDASVQERLVKLNHEIPLDFPPNVLAEADALEQSAFGRQDGTDASDVSDAGRATDLDGLSVLVDLAQAPPLSVLPHESTATRQDLRAVPFVTIDGADARDFDDAVYARSVSNAADKTVTWELWVAIADVSYFVRPDRKPGAALDREARERGNSYYFPTSVEPMLPEVLSNGLCSLRPNEDRLVMAARIGFDDHGVPRCSAFFPGVIRSLARLTYEGVQALLDGQGEAEILPLHPYIKDAEALAQILRRQRQERGSLDFDLPEAQFVVDAASGKVTDILRRERLFSHRIIEEFMLAANEAVARFLTEKGLPFPYRIHSAPDPERLAQLFRTLATTDLVQMGQLASLLAAGKRERGVQEWHRDTAHGRRRGVAERKSTKGSESSKEAFNPAVLRDILVQAAGTPQEYLVGRLVLRSLMQARYAPELEAHFGLASPCYCHFTSPIRRYADLLVHRALAFALGTSRAPVLAGQKLLAVTDQCNARERAATEAEREIARRLGCLLLQERVGETFTGIISGVTDFGFFVEFDVVPVEGMVRLDSIQDDWFEYNLDRQELLGVSTGRRFRLGQTLSVRLVEVHVGRLEITLEVPTNTEKTSSSRRSAGGRAGKGLPSTRERNGFVPRHKRR